MEILKSCLNFVEVWGALIIAAISLLIAGISLAKSSKAQKYRLKQMSWNSALKNMSLRPSRKNKQMLTRHVSKQE